MRKIILKILNEDSEKRDSLQVKKDNKIDLIVAGDSIANLMCVSALNRKGAKSSEYRIIKGKKVKRKWNDIVPDFPAIQSGQDTRWVKDRLISQLSDKNKNWKNYKLIIIAGTNDGVTYAKFPKGKRNPKSAIENIDAMATASQKLGIDFTVMKLAPYDPRGDYEHKKLNEEQKKLHEEFIQQFNTAISKYKNFEMVYPTHEDGLHIYGKAKNKKLYDRAMKSLSMDHRNVQLPTSLNSVSITPDGSISSRDCHINDYCYCVDSSVSDVVTIIGVQRALKILGINVQDTGNCDRQTREAIQKFQKQQQESGFRPPDGREFLRCDACVGPNTTAAINLALQKISSKSSLESISAKSEEKKKLKIKVATTSNQSISTSFTKTPEKRKYNIYELYEISKKHAPPNATEDDIITMAAIAVAESGGISKTKFGCKNATKNPKYSSTARAAARRKDKELGNKRQELEREYLKNNPMFFGQGAGCRFGDNSLGLWQINMIRPSTKKRNFAKYNMTSENDLLNPDKNCQIAWDYWKMRKFKPWSTWLRRGEPGDRMTPQIIKLRSMIKKRRTITEKIEKQKQENI